MELKKMKNKKNQETEGYGRDKRPEIEKLKKEEVMMTKTRKKLKQRKKSVKQSMFLFSSFISYSATSCHRCTETQLPVLKLSVISSLVHQLKCSRSLEK